jgi:hypothetical protein
LRRSSSVLLRAVSSSVVIRISCAPSSQSRALNSFTVKPACRMMALNVPLATSLWSGTVMRRCGGTVCRRTMWLPRCRSLPYPIFRRAFTTSRPETRGRVVTREPLPTPQ